MPEIAAFLKRTMPEVAKKVPAKTIPAFVVKLASLFNEQAKTGAMSINVNHNVSNAKAKKMLDWKPIATIEQTILASTESMIKFGIIN